MIGSGAGATDTLTLEPHPTSPGAARRHIAQLLEAGPLAELVETAALLVSELVTNAVLHAATAIELSCRIEAGSVWVEVKDHSSVAPSVRHYDATASTGRGLGLVEGLADDWGIDVDEGGKTVWFLLAGPEAASMAPRTPSLHPPSPPGSFDVELRNLPVELVIATIQYGDAVLREVMLLTIAAPARSGRGNGRPVSKIDLGPLLALVEAQRTGPPSVDIVLAFPDGSGPAALERLALVDEADRMARDGELLTLPAVPEIAACRRWLYGQISFQADGLAPVPWSMPAPMDPVVPAAQLPEEERRRLDALHQATVVADDANRILYVSPAAAAVLGWEGDELVGRRLISLVPPEMRAAHLAGFTRYLLTGEARLLGRPVRLPALRRDGSVVEVDITIALIDLGGRQAFRATFS